MKRIYGGKELLMKAKNEAKRKDKRRVKRLVKRQTKRLVGISAGPTVKPAEIANPESSN
jgi:hypothetical protein